MRGISLNSNFVSLNQQSLGAKFDGSQITQLHVQGTKPNHASLSCGILQSSSSKSKYKVQKFAHTQTRHLLTSPEASLPASQDISNVKCIGKVKLKVQVNSSLYSHAQPATKLGSAPCNISSNFINAQQNSLKSRLTRGEVMGSMTITIQSETPTEEDCVAHFREYWRIKKREQRASRAARLGNVLIRSKVSVLKQREQNKNVKPKAQYYVIHCHNSL